MNYGLIRKIEQLSALDFISQLTIQGKDKRLVKLTPTREQIEYIQTIEGGEDCIFLKPRQIGSSTIVCAYFYWLAYTANYPIALAIISFKLESTASMLNIIKTFHFNMPSPIRKPLIIDNAKGIKFKHGPEINIYSSRQKGGVRGKTLSKAMLTEYAYAEGAEELMAQVYAALNGGQMIFESTANYFNDCLHKEILKAITGRANYEYRFFDWRGQPEYSKDLPDVWELSDEETEFKNEWDLSDEQICWRRESVSKLGLEKFTREYPLSIEQAYQISGNTYFSHTDFQYISPMQVYPTEWTTLEEPIRGNKYAIGVDTSGGVGRDFSVVFVVNVNSMQPVCIFRSNTVSPIALAEYIYTASVSYNDALVLIEDNNYGLATINELGHQGCRKLWKCANDKDFKTTGKTKPLVFENLKKHIQSGLIKILDSITLMELKSITVDAKGIIKFSDLIDSHSDSAMAMALAYWCALDVRIHDHDREFLPEWVRKEGAKQIRDNAGVGMKAHRRY